MKINKKNLLILFITLIVIMIIVIIGFLTYRQISITGKAVSGTCSGTDNCGNFNKENQCNDHCACSWVDGSCTSVGCSSCSDQTTCEDSACTWTTIETITVGGGGGGVQRVVGIVPRAPLDADIIKHGILELKIQIYYAGEPSNGAKVKANSTMFGEVKLVHKSELPKGIYIANVTIGKDVKSGKQRITYTATQSNQFDEFSILLELKHSLAIKINLNEKYFKGSKIKFSGTVLDLEELPVPNATINIESYHKESRVFSVISKTDETGHFSTDYFIKHADPEGVWDITIDAVSEDEKVGVVSFSPKIEVPSGVSYYSVNFLSPLKDSLFRRGELIPLTVEVKEIDNLIEGADVVVYTPDEEAINLKEVEPGKYSGNYLVEPDDILGNWFLRAEVSKQVGHIRKVGGANLLIKIDPAEIKFSLLKPETEVIYTNSRLKIKTKLTYPDGSLVKGASLNAFLSNGEIISLLEKSDGVYEGNYFVTIKDIGTLDVEIRAKDANNNLGSLKPAFFIRKRSVVGNLLAYLKEGARKYWWAILAFLIATAFIYRPTFEISWINRRLQKAKEEQKRVKAMQLDTEKKYYKEGSITKKEFRELMTKYETRLAKAKENQKVLEKSLSEKINKIKK